MQGRHSICNCKPSWGRAVRKQGQDCWNRRLRRNSGEVIQDVLWHYGVLNATAALLLVPGKCWLHPAPAEQLRLTSPCPNYPLRFFMYILPPSLSCLPGWRRLNFLWSEKNLLQNLKVFLPYAAQTRSWFHWCAEELSILAGNWYFWGLRW